MTDSRRRPFGWLLALSLVTTGCAPAADWEDEEDVDEEVEQEESAATSPGAESEFFRMMNAERAANGLAGLAPSWGARVVARAWSAKMADESHLHHRADLAAQVSSWVTTSWLRIGENVGHGGDVAGLHRAFMDSPGHRANVLGDYDHVGVGAEDRGGSIWVTFVFVKAPGAIAMPGGVSGCGEIRAGEGLNPGEGVRSCDGRFLLTLQSDGNLVLYQDGAGALWSTGTYGRGGWATHMQGDGNLVLYTKDSAPVFASGTSGHGGGWTAVQDDGNVVVYDGSGRALWASHTSGR
jgi:hypothetical protein